MRRLFPSRLVIPSTTLQSAEMQALYDTRNRAERIRFAQKKRLEGYTINDIALLLHSATTTIKKYLSIPEDEIPQPQENVMERKYIQQMEDKKAAVEEVRNLFSKGHTADEISRMTGHTWKTVTNSWIELAAALQIDELDTYISGLKKDLTAVKNGIDYKYNNGLAEGSVNKIKLAKRIMYGRNSFSLLKAKILLNEHFHQIN
jgi:transposase